MYIVHLYKGKKRQFHTKSQLQLTLSLNNISLKEDILSVPNWVSVIKRVTVSFLLSIILGKILVHDKICHALATKIKYYVYNHWSKA